MNKRMVGTGLAALALLAPPRADAQRLAYEDYRLDNGLRVILAPDPASPTVAVNVWYDVGARDERPGRTGFAHLFEHMMFQGSANVGKGEHFILVERAGGDLQNGTTDWDRTNYYQTFPSNRLNLGLWLESDRMRSLAVTQENFTNQQQVVQEEKRERTENVPYMPALWATLTGVYNAQTCFGYAHEIVGSFEDLRAAPVEDVQQFFRTYYAPNNATLTLAGGFDVNEAKAMIRQYFGDIPSAPAPQRTTCTEPFSHLPVTRTVQDARAPLAAVMIAYGLPGPDEADFYALELLNALLVQGETARLQDRLVDQEKAAVDVNGFFLEHRGPGTAFFWLNAAPEVTGERLLTIFDEEVARVTREGIPAEELQKAKNQRRAQVIFERQIPHGTAEALQHAIHFHGGPQAADAKLERYLAVTPDDVRRAAERWLSPRNRAVTHVVPAPTAGQE
jgi:predicted Zn-dependent peptidase